MSIFSCSLLKVNKINDRVTNGQCGFLMETWTCRVTTRAPSWADGPVLLLLQARPGQVSSISADYGCPGGAAANTSLAEESSEGNLCSSSPQHSSSGLTKNQQVLWRFSKNSKKKEARIWWEHLPSCEAWGWRHDNFQWCGLHPLRVGHSSSHDNVNRLNVTFKKSCSCSLSTPVHRVKGPLKQR